MSCRGFLAAQPPAVRKAYGFPSGALSFEAMPLIPEAQPQDEWLGLGKAKPYRTEGGRAADLTFEAGISIYDSRFTIYERPMSEINVQLGHGPATQMPAPVTVGEALKKLDREAAKQALAARVNGREVDLAFTLDAQQNGEALEIEPVLPQTLEGLDVLRHSTAHLLAAAVLDLFPGTKLGIGPALLEDPRYGFFYDVIAPQPLTETDLPIIEKRMRQIASRNLAYRREEIPKAKALEIFKTAKSP